MSGGMLLWTFIGNKVRGISEVTTTAATQLINHKDALVLDVREQDEFNGGHILNAKLIPHGALVTRIGEIERHRDLPVVVVCRSGMRSAMACATLKKQGFTQAHSLSGGMIAWMKANLPVEK
ncbi:MAG: rhodanese-like domain-containing protein [Nitrosomonadales bacterium]|nr:rhodanese-like domain-containing protein [Nitrosomonadales bacterium]